MTFLHKEDIGGGDIFRFHGVLTETAPMGCVLGSSASPIYFRDVFQTGFILIFPSFEEPVS